MVNFLSLLEAWIRRIVVWLTKFVPVKTIRDDRGVPFLYRYHLFSLYKDGPALCIHHFVKSDPDRGFHDHPWRHAIGFILCGGYTEAILGEPLQPGDDETDDYANGINCRGRRPSKVIERSRWSFGYLTGTMFHRVLLKKNQDAWTIFYSGDRVKIWNMVTFATERLLL